MNLLHMEIPRSYQEYLAQDDVMEIEISNDKENKLFGRREFSFKITYDGKTPSKEEVKESLCKKLGLSPDLTMIMKVAQLYGSEESRGIAYSYSDKGLFAKLEKHEAKMKEKAKAPQEKKASAAAT